MRPWQKDFIRDVYEPHKDGKRIVRSAVLSIGRKNGKTPLIAAICLAHLIGPEAEMNGEIYSAANERDQAAQVFKYAAQMVRAEPELVKRLKVIDSTKTISCYGNGSFYRALSAEAGSKHGQNATVVVYDELAQAKNRELFDVLDTATGAREEPLMVVISTQAKDPEHVLSQLIDDGLNSDDPTTVTHLYAVPDDVEDIFDEKNWYAANPALGDFRSLEEMRAKARRAKRMPSFENNFRNLYLNQRVDIQSPLIPRAEWMACRGDGLELGEPVFLGLDLSATTDLTALVAVSAHDGDRVKAWFWKPDQMVEEHEKRDRAPYGKWVKEGWLETAGERAIDYGWLAAKVAEIATDFEVMAIAYDRWRIENLLKEFNDQGIDAWIDGKDRPMAGALRLVPWGQGFKDISPALDELETSILQRDFQHDGNPLLAWCFANAIAVSDPAGNRKLDKAKSRFRIDGAVAAAMAVGVKRRLITEVQPSVYEERGVRII